MPTRTATASTSNTGTSSDWDHERGRGGRERVDSWGRVPRGGGSSSNSRNQRSNLGDRGDDHGRRQRFDRDYYGSEKEDHSENVLVESNAYCRECDTTLEDEDGRLVCPRCTGTQRARANSGRDQDRRNENEQHRKKRRMSDDHHVHDRDNSRPQFPGPFELYPEDYILDSATGYFFQEWTDFFHCPKSKLYFHQEGGRYYSFDKGEDLYVDVDNNYGMAKMQMKTDKKEKLDRGDDLVVQALQGAKKTNVVGVKNKISITIKQQGDKKKSSKKAIAKKATTEEGRPKGLIRGTENQQSQHQKAHQDDIEKWSQRAKGSEMSVSFANNSPNVVLLPEKGRIRKTKSGKPVCMLCKRKFGSLEKLEKHISSSELHKFNLTKVNPSGNDPNRSYLDRALNRRVLYEEHNAPTVPLMDANEVKDMMAPSLEHAREVEISEAIRPEDNLGTANIGNKMLQKLGWKGGSLGRKGNFDSKTDSALKKDWEKIERAAISKNR